MSLRAKILLLFGLSWLVAIASISSISIGNQIRSEKNKVVTSNISALTDVRQTMESYLETVDMIGIRFSVDENVRTLLDRGYMDADRTKQIGTLLGVARNFRNSDFITSLSTSNSVLLLSDDGRVYTNYHAMVGEYSQSVNGMLVDQDILRQIGFRDAAYYGFSVAPAVIRNTNYPNQIQYFRKFHLGLGSGRAGGVVLLMRQDGFREAFSRSATADNDGWTICGRDGVILSAQDAKLIGKNVAEVYGAQPEQSADGSMRAKSGKGFLTYARSWRTGLSYAYYTSNLRIFHSCRQSIFVMILVSLGGIAVTLWLSWYLSKRFTDPLRKLGNIMEQAENGDLSVRMNPRYQDEIAVLGRHFDHMIGELARSMEDVQTIEKEKRQTELRVLQLQVNPHFLYNTLSTIIWLANENRNEDVIGVTKSLATFYRMALSTGGEMISVRDELEHIRCYLTIQQYRFQDDLEVEYEVPARIGQYQMLKLLLQPIVENAINHGTATLENRKGVIRIRADDADGALTFRVMDNGSEMTQEKVEALNERLRENRETGIGTSNVSGRIRANYGEGYGLRFSREGDWTVAAIRLPIQNGEGKP